MVLPIRNQASPVLPAPVASDKHSPADIPDRVNYSFFGKAWKDRSNGVALLSSKIGHGERLSKLAQDTHQQNLLNVRTAMFVETLKTPCVIRKETIGPFDAPYMKIPVPTLLNARIFSKKSFNESVAFKKVASAFVKSNEDVRADFLDKFPALIESKGLSQDAKTRMTELYDALKLSSGDTKNTADLPALHARKTELQEQKDAIKKKSGELGLFFSSVSSKLLNVERKIAAIEKPSSYKIHLARKFENREIDRPLKVTDHPLYVEELKKRGDGRVSRIPLTDAMSKARDEARATGIEPEGSPPAIQEIGLLASPKDIQVYTEKKFNELSKAIREFQHAGASADAEKKLENLVRPILYSKERVAVHRFILDMVRQLKRAGISKPDLADRIHEQEIYKSELSSRVSNGPHYVSLTPAGPTRVPVEAVSSASLAQIRRAECSIQELTHQTRLLEELENLIPEAANGGMVLLQSITHGTGKQLRLQDEAERMLQALPKVLKLVKIHQAKLQQNLMSFNLDGVTALRTDVQLNSETASPATLRFLKSSQGKSFSEVLIKSCENTPGSQPADIRKLKASRNKPEQFLFYLQEVSRQIGDVLISDELIKTHQHIFMESSDIEFWEREAIGKIATRLDGSQIPDNVKTTSRIFKQMQMRAGALEMDEQGVKNFMMQGIANTLQNRNMAVEGSRMGGIIGAAAANLASTPLTVPMAKISPILAAPGIADAMLMPIGWGMGIVPGALGIGKFLANRKKERLAEVGNLAQSVNVFPSNRQTRENRGNTLPPSSQVQLSEMSKYTSHAKAPEWSAKNGARMVQTKKPALNPQNASAATQFANAHGKVWADIGKETVAVVGKTMRYAFYQGPRDAWIDLVLHREIKRKKAA